MIKFDNYNGALNRVVMSDGSPVNKVVDLYGNILWSAQTYKADFVSVGIEGYYIAGQPVVNVSYSPSSGFDGERCTAYIVVLGQFGKSYSGTPYSVGIDLYDNAMGGSLSDSAYYDGNTVDADNYIDFYWTASVEGFINKGSYLILLNVLGDNH